MQTFINIVNDLVIILGNLIIFSCMLNFKEMKLYKKLIVFGMCILFTVAYTLCVYLAHMAYIHATLLCFTVPSLILFWGFSKIKDSRFFLSFCIVDTISLIIAFVTKYFAIFYEEIAPYITLLINIIVYAAIIIGGHKFFKRYAQLMLFQKAGWRNMMIASFIIYFALYFLAAYPIPLKERLDDVPAYFVFCGVILSCYVVFWDSMIKTKKMHDQYTELEKERDFHQIAYKDSLTGLYNRFYYMEKIHEIERKIQEYNKICCIVLDLNNFKYVNDNFGHHTGDLVLQDVANSISNVFQDYSSQIFRIGGDEFFILSFDCPEEIINQKISQLHSEIQTNEKIQGQTLSIAAGYSFIDVQNDNPRQSIEQAFMVADKKMYENKNTYKTDCPTEYSKSDSETHPAESTD